MRNWFLLLVQILIPVVFISVIILIVRSFDDTKDLPKLELSLDTYDKSSSIVQFDPKIRNDSTLSKVRDNYLNQFRNQFELEMISSDLGMNDYYLRKTKNLPISQVNRENLYGVTIEPSKITVWYNNKPYHTPPISLSLVHNAILKTVCGPNCNITVVNHPLPYHNISRSIMQKALSNLSFQLSFNISFAMAFVASFFAIAYIKERVTKAKLLQFISGINVLMYWSTAFLYDILTFSFIALLVTITIGVFQEDGYRTFPQLSIVYLIFVTFGAAILPCVYIASLLLNAAASGFTKLTVIFMLPGVAMFTVSYCLRFEAFNLQNVADNLTTVFLAFPHFSLSNAISNMNLVNITVFECKEQCRVNGVCGKKLCNDYSKCCSEFQILL